MSAKSFFLFAGGVILLGFTTFSLHQNSELTGTVSSLQERLRTTEAGLSERTAQLDQAIHGLHEETAKNKTLTERIGEFESYGSSDPQHISAAFAKAVEDHEVYIDLDFVGSTVWESSPELREGEEIPAGVERRVTLGLGAKLPRRNGLFLGTRSHMSFFLAALDDAEREVRLSAIRQPDDIVTIPGRFYRAAHKFPFKPQESSFKLNISVSGKRANWAKASAVVMHAWEGEKVMRVVIGLKEEGAADVDMFPSVGDANWAKLMETPGNRYPISMANGCIALVQRDFGRFYGYKGERGAWHGIPRSVHQVFMPIGLTSRPVVHSLMYQMGTDETLFFPAWAERQQMEAIPIELNLDSWFRLLAVIDYISPEKARKEEVVSWGQQKGDGAFRQGLLGSYKTLIHTGQVIDR